MRGTKRLAMSDSTPIFSSNETSMQRKRVTMGSAYNGQGTEPSIQPPRQPSPLNMQRAESSRQHVKTLNTQFASWVQAQLLNHPDELWEDGVQDYLNHAKSIMEKFSDVVNWLKVNAVKGERSSELQSNDPPVKSTSAIGKINHQPSVDRPGFPLAASPSPGTSWHPGGSLFGNNTPFTFGGNQVPVPGNANSVFSNHDASNDADGGKG